MGAGITYATFVLGVGLSMLFGPPDTEPQKNRNALTFGTAIQPWVTPGQENLLTLTHRRSALVWGKFIPIYSLGVSDKGTGFASAGLGRPLSIAGIKVLPFFGPALFADRHNDDLLQFRTGFDISQDFENGLSVTAGFYHISNGQANPASADLDVAHLGFLLKF